MNEFRTTRRERRTPEFREVLPTGKRDEKPRPGDSRVKGAAGGETAAQVATASATPVRAAGGPTVCWKVARVARHLDLSKKRVYQLVAAGRLDVVRMGPRGMRVLVPSIERYVEGLMTMERRFRGEE